ncbi:GGDEF domain-containing protein [Vibrio ouci]|uniref:GGDEF domain-containing protein n=1 Tax=Vibrio ouci TaxID=2499078 RepID=UPI001FC9EB14|nr:GGDEF domain-containing protein [Vibrio ouci]
MDELTGLYNRKKLPEIRMEFFDLIYLDLDGLKKVNDTKGHAVGDLMIIRFAQAINQIIDRHEQAFRVGGDEFVIVAKPSEGSKFVDKLKEELNGENINFSYGIEATNIKELGKALEKTDQAMYQMKNSQRDS